MKIALFLGAGASEPLSKPLTTTFKEKLSAKLSMDSVSYWFTNHYGYSDVEELLQAIREIRDFWDGFGGKYLRHVYKLSVEDSNQKIPFDKFVTEIIELEKIIQETVFEVYRWDQKSDKLLKKTYTPIFNFLEEYSEKIMIFTTNYDRAIEEYCERISEKHICDDGFYLYPRTQRFIWGGHSYDNKPSKMKTVFLHKIHGSLNWKEHTDGSYYTIQRTSEESKSVDPNYPDNILIFPTLSPKDRHQLEPFKSLGLEFANYMEQADVCIVIGFSFRDNHLKGIFRDFIRNGKKFIIVSPSAKKDYGDNLLIDVVKKSDGTDQPLVTAFVKDTTKVSFIEKKLTPDNVTEIIHDIKRIIEPEKHPF